MKSVEDVYKESYDLAKEIKDAKTFRYFPNTHIRSKSYVLENVSNLRFYLSSRTCEVFSSHQLCYNHSPFQREKMRFDNNFYIIPFNELITTEENVPFFFRVVGSYLSAHSEFVLKKPSNDEMGIYRAVIPSLTEAIYYKSVGEKDRFTNKCLSLLQRESKYICELMECDAEDEVSETVRKVTIADFYRDAIGSEVALSAIENRSSVGYFIDQLMFSDDREKTIKELGIEDGFKVLSKKIGEVK